MAVIMSQNGVVIRESGINVIGGKKYRTVKMPDGKVWLAESLDFKFCNVGGSETPTTANAWYYNNDEATYGWSGYKCGLLYNWYAVKLLNDNRSELCPGWHVPTIDECDNMVTACGGDSTTGSKLKSLNNSVTSNWPYDWNGTNNYGFSAIPTSFRDNIGNFSLYDAGWTAWTITTYNDQNSHHIYLLGNSQVAYSGHYYKVGGLSLRLVRDT